MRVLLLAAVLLAGAASTAHADTIQPGAYNGPFTLEAGPIMMGDQLVWAASTPFKSDGDGEQSSSTSLYSAPAAGGAARRIARVGGMVTYGEYERGEEVLTLAGSPGRLASMTVRFDSAAAKYQMPIEDAYGMSVFGQGTLCRGDETFAPAVQTTAIALSGDTLALSGCDGAPGVTVRDLAHPETPPQTLAPDGGPVSLAGNYVAWRTGDGFLLFDRATGTRTAFAATGLPAAISEFDVSPEGVLAVTTGALPGYYSSGAQAAYVSWASAAEPSWHTHQVPGLIQGGLRVRANRIALLTRDGDGMTRQLRLVDLAGAQTVIAEGPGRQRATSFDFDGATLVWGTTACDTLIVGSRPIAAGKLTLSGADHCPVAIDPAAVRAGRRGPLIGLRCPLPALPRASDRCAGSLTLKRGGRAIGSARFKTAGGTWGEARIKLTASGRRAVARHARLRVTVEARSVTRGHASRSTQRITLRR